MTSLEVVFLSLNVVKLIRFTDVLVTSPEVIFEYPEHVEAACFIDVLAMSLEVDLAAPFVLKHLALRMIS